MTEPSGTKPIPAPHSDTATDDAAAGAAGRPSASTAGEERPQPEEEIGGPKGPEPTRFGDWERKGRCIDF